MTETLLEKYVRAIKSFKNMDVGLDAAIVLGENVFIPIEKQKEELSNEDISKEASSRYEAEEDIDAFIKGAKWYKKQLKLKQSKTI